MDNLFINLCYESPSFDFENLMQNNHTGVDTLIALRAMLMSNVNILDQLLASSITDAEPAGLGLISVKISNSNDKDRLLSESVLKQINNNVYVRETNSDRFRMLNRLIDQDDIQYVLGQNKDHDTNIVDDTRRNTLLNKYEELLNS